MHEITQLLKTEHTFDQAYNCLVKYSRQQSIIAYIARKQDMQRLLFELRRLAKYSPKPVRSAVGVNIKAKPNVKQDNVPEGFIKHKHTDRDSLPDNLRELYDDNSKSYKYIRTYHEKMKLCSTDAEREKLMSDISQLSKSIRTNWDKIDSWLSNKSTAKNEINAKKRYLGRLLKKAEWSEDILNKACQTYKELVGLNAEIKPEMINILQERGVNCS